MYKKRIVTLLLSMVLFQLWAYAIKEIAIIDKQQLEASGNEEVYSTLHLLKPGDELLLTDGVYKDIKLILNCSGEKDYPITIRAKNPGKVFISGDAKVEMRGEHLILEGFYFKEGNRDINKWKSHGPGLVAIYGSHNRVTNCVFDFFDDANSAYITTSLTEDGKVPQFCRIDHCTFTDKITFDQVINLNNTQKAIKDGAASGPPMYHRVDHCFFSNPKKPGNAGGGIRIGYYRNDIGRCLIDSNLFVRQDSEPEIITSKSQENVFYNNTYVNCQGTMNLRHGDHQVAINNFFIGSDTKYEYGGMFIWGSEHIIACNYFELPTTIKSRGNAALYLNPGPIGSEHALAFNSLIINNSFVNVNGYAIHFNPLDERRKEFSKENNLTFEVPNNLNIKGNIFYSGQNPTYPFFKDDYLLGRNSWDNNFAFGSKTGIFLNKGIVKKNLHIKKDSNGVFRPASDSNYALSKVNDVKLIEGIDLDLNYLINQGITGKPLVWEDVKPYWLKEIPGTYASEGKLSPEREARFQKVINRDKSN